MPYVSILDAFYTDLTYYIIAAYCQIKKGKNTDVNIHSDPCY